MSQRGEYSRVPASESIEMRGAADDRAHKPAAGADEQHSQFVVVGSVVFYLVAALVVRVSSSLIRVWHARALIACEHQMVMANKWVLNKVEVRRGCRSLMSCSLADMRAGFAHRSRSSWSFASSSLPSCCCTSPPSLVRAPKRPLYSLARVSKATRRLMSVHRLLQAAASGRDGEQRRDAVDRVQLPRPCLCAYRRALVAQPACWWLTLGDSSVAQNTYCLREHPASHRQWTGG